MTNEQKIEPRLVTSKTNATYKMLRSLATSQGIKDAGQTLLAGEKIIADVVARGDAGAVAWVVRGDLRREMLAPFTGKSFAAVATLPVIELSGELFREIDVIGTDGALLLTKVPDLPVWVPQAAWPRGCTLFVGFQNPENIGAVLRSAAAFGVARVVLLKGAAHPFLPKSLRAASAAAFQVPLQLGPAIADLVSVVPVAMPLLTLDARGHDLASMPFPETFGLVPGVEGPGLPPDFPAAGRRRIPIEAGVESLNATVATAIALYAWRAAGKSLIAR